MHRTHASGNNSTAASESSLPRSAQVVGGGKTFNESGGACEGVSAIAAEAPEPIRMLSYCSQKIGREKGVQRTGEPILIDAVGGDVDGDGERGAVRKR